MDFQSTPRSPFSPRLPHPPLPTSTTTNTLGILSSHIFPSLTLHTTLSLAAYSAGRFTNRLDAKDLLWPSAFVGNVWYHGVVWPYMSGRGRGVWEFIREMGYGNKLILGGVTVWGCRLFWKVFWRVKGRERDDGRYERYREVIRRKKGKGDLEKAVVIDEGEVEREMWNKAFLGIFLPEAVVQSFVSLGWSGVGYSRSYGSFNHPDQGSIGDTKWVHGIAVGVFAAGLALEVLADSQLGRSKKKKGKIVRDGVWSIVRHPNYLGDFLVHLSFPLMALADGVFNPIMFIGPIANYIFLRFIGGDKENEQYQMEKYKKEGAEKYEEYKEWKAEKNSFWPGIREVGNLWTWVVVGIGGLAAAGEFYICNSTYTIVNVN
ncbi:hypothetical protein AOL_s00109g115 [Orbilia oligospora ATCC 24927]|uniref:Steroid 5-alpha reductase C-terminal domain-containing protein n=2 Tax=Orbilia oligospora TaxID=2813651 RepID=G1XK86_ARTOA|nr:hypothetical protein AOL_s00109g115 [Orbilia oligospora ATCC 24927]EGX46543.1 hypothetical protein AOL_s00109g115 [Orbilia oligospora ATCC 24927]KAF3289720.1 hypothetical protein TWF970_003481 [Orbilia oligospora]